ncbi:MAG: cytochrome-c peroxidase [Acidobacteriota bacterium]
MGRWATGSALALSLLPSGCGQGGKGRSSTQPVPQTVADLPIETVGEGYDADRLIPADNPMTAPKVALGMELFFDTRLSADGTISCATCHDPARYYTDRRKTSLGIRGQSGSRNAPTVVNATYMYFQFWDGRAASLEEQALAPIQNPVEMGQDLDALLTTLSGIKGYADAFQSVFGRPVNGQDLARAIAAFERTLLSGNSSWDRYNRGEREALSTEARRGWDLFTGKARCSKCHAGFNLSDSDFHNLGVGMKAQNPDLGRYQVTHEEKDRGAFRTPTLRDVQHTAPYMHDGSLATMEEVIDWYDRGGEPNPWLDAQMRPLHLTPQEESDLLALLKSLDGERVRVDLRAPELP